MANVALGPKRPNKVKRQPYESGLPSEVKKSFRFGISFYLIAMLFILFAIEMITTIGSPRNDLSRFGAEVIRFTPRQADMLILSGRVSVKMAPIIRRIYDQM